MSKISNAEVRAIAARQRHARQVAPIHAMVGAPVRPHELSSTERAIALLLGK